MAETDDYIAIRRLQDRYADTCSRQAWVEFDELFVPEARIALDLRDRTLEFTGPSEISGFIANSLNQFSFFQFVIRNAVVDLNVDTVDDAAGRMWMSEFRKHVDDGRFSTIFGLYQDRFIRTPDGWRFSRRRYQSVARPDTGDVFDVDEPGFGAY